MFSIANLYQGIYNRIQNEFGMDRKGKIVIDIHDFCTFLYSASYVPVYLFEHKELTFSYPDQDKSTSPPLQYLEKLLEADTQVSFTATQFYSYYGCIRIKNSNSNLIIGPVNDFPYTTETLSVMTNDFSIGKSDFDNFAEFFHNIPQQNLDQFVKLLLFINYSLNQTKVSREEVQQSVGYQIDRSIDQKYTEKSVEAKEEGLLLNNYAVEKELVRYIETGNLAGLNKLTNRTRNLKIGTIAHNTLRQWKNTFIIALTIYTRAAMKGGLTPTVSYQLADIYLQQVERLTNVDEVKALINQVQIDYVNRVANSILPITSDNILHQVVQYVRDNTNKNITVQTIAEFVGYSRPSLSRKVKRELGFDLSTFIRKCKLEEARDLLAYTDKSISEISNYLCFSSQSHFQKTFKALFGITPHAYRKLEQVRGNEEPTGSHVSMSIQLKKL
ncbi:helix-turn-helix domain-containing protein [Paenibacillus illinoisensis]|uniref:helix-turn-helix domain-containing protein n=1 Tax=Paenibacillus illinoisensis TaxID=59845 RepID=UPI001C8D81EA|nr:helix-turn-helix domain-containing protein [Paenibacillus illinoisensis]